MDLNDFHRPKGWKTDSLNVKYVLLAPAVPLVKHYASESEIFQGSLFFKSEKLLVYVTVAEFRAICKARSAGALIQSAIMN